VPDIGFMAVPTKAVEGGDLLAEFGAH
jgi:hypothetical protein